MSSVAPIGNEDPDAGVRYEPLLETESSVMCFLYEPAVTTVSYFKSGNHTKSAAVLRERLRLICEANPWLAGRLVRDKKRHADRVLLMASKAITDNDVDAIFSTEDSELSTSLKSTSPYAEQSSAVIASKAQVPVGYKLIGKETRVSKFTLVPIDTGLAFIVSMTHAVVDGYTYYRILSMLTDSASIEALAWTRKQEFVPKMKHAIGEKEHQMLLSAGLTLGMVLPKVCCGGSGPTVFQARFVDPEKVHQAKAEATSRCGKNMTFACSTNDILTSTFAKATGATLTLMAVNLRDRIESIEMSDSGNYESVLVYDEPSAAKPELIRRSLTKGSDDVYRRVEGQALPGFFKLLRSKFAMITNWAFPSFQADLKLRGDHDEEESDGMYLHLPVYDPKAIFFPIAIIFRPSAGKLAVLYLASHRDLTHDRLVSSGAPLGGRVDDRIFE